MDDFRAMKNPIVATTVFAHVLGERMYVSNYKQYIDKVEQTELNTEDKETKGIHMVNLDFDGVLNNAHMAGQIFEKDVLADFFEQNGKSPRLIVPANGESFDKGLMGKIRLLRYAGINIFLTSGNNENNIISTDIEIPDKSIQPKKASSSNETSTNDKSN